MSAGRVKGWARREFFLAALAATTAPAWAAPAKRIGVFLEANEEQARGIVAMLAKALRAHQWREGVNLEIVLVALGGKATPEAAAALVRRGVDVLFTAGNPPTQLLQQATRTIPIVAIVGEAVASGFAKSLARPGSNITGLAFSLYAVLAKSLELASALVPRFSRVRVFAVETYSEGNSRQTFILEGQRAGVAIEFVIVASLGDLAQGFKGLSIAEGGAAFIITLPFELREVAELAIARKVATLSPYKEEVRDGLLASYSKDFGDEMARVAALVDKVLRGTKPAEIPFEQPTQTHISINKRTAAALGLVIPPDLLLRADEVVP
ncbi:MAG: ABC transporter substrate-binding protein [Usitatibacter sp.]